MRLAIHSDLSFFIGRLPRSLLPSRPQYKVQAKASKSAGREPRKDLELDSLLDEAENEEDFEDDEDLYSEQPTTEEQRLTAEYLASLDSQWGEDPLGHRSGIYCL